MRPSHLWIFESASCAGDFAARGRIGQSRRHQGCISRAGKKCPPCETRQSRLRIFESAACAGDFAPRGHIGQSRPRQDCISRAGKNALQAKRAHRACGYIFEIRILCRRFCGARPHRAKPPSSGLYLSSGQKCSPSETRPSRLRIFESAACAGDFAPRGHIGQSRPRQSCISRAGKNALHANWPRAGRKIVFIKN